MEGRRRRAQRLTQDIQQQPEGETELNMTEPERAPEAAFVPSERDGAAESAVHTQGRRRRNAQMNVERQAEPEPPKTEKKANKLHKKKTAKRNGLERLQMLVSQAALAAGILPAAAKAGAERLWKAAGQLWGAIMRAAQRLKKEELPEEQDAYELEIVRPRDYYGRGEAHAHKTAPAKRMDRTVLISRGISAILLCVALYSAWQIGSIVLRSIRTNQLNETLSRERAATIEAQNRGEEKDETQPLSDGQQDDAQPALAKTAEAASAPEDGGAFAGPMSTPVPNIVKNTKYRSIGGDALPEMAELYEKNRDLVAWIQIPDVLDLPVVYRDNDYYLMRDFNKQKNAAGTIFLDVNHPFKEKTQNLLLHGHNMKDGTMFGRLAQYLYDDTYIRNHPFIYFDTLWNKEQYVILAVLDVSINPGDSRFFNYFTHATFSSDAEFEMYIRQLQLHSAYAIPIDVTPSDALLTLSTCLDEDRLVIVARRLRPGETRSELRTLIRMTTRQ